jgi:hypothetical protein
MARTRTSTRVPREAPIPRVSATAAGRSDARWVMSPEMIEHERDIIRNKFLAQIQKRKLKIDLSVPPLKIPTHQIRHNESEIKKRWYKSPQAWESHNRRVAELVKLFQARKPLPPVMARQLGPGRYRIWDGNHRLIASKRAGVPYVYIFPVLTTQPGQATERPHIHYKGVLYEQVPAGPKPPRK